MPSNPRLGRLQEFDERSREFPVRALLSRQPKLHSRIWTCAPRLDQGPTSSCVGHAWAHEIAAVPIVVPVSGDLAARIYRRAQQLDQWPGEEPTYEGTSVLAGAKAVKEMDFMTEYRWAFGIDDVIHTLGTIGPVVLGTSWYSGMFDADGGIISVSGQNAGGHAYLARGVDLRRERVLIHNSWGRDWGRGGMAWISFADLARLLSEWGEACVPIGRKVPFDG